ncbi:MAG: hypothetical protein WCS96_11035 [Victivallales bacterium]|jgi:hypothetical protein
MKFSKSLVMASALNLFCLPVFSQGIIIDHNCTDISKVPRENIEKAKTQFKVAYGHTSHGSQIVSGMDALKRSDPSFFAFTKDSAPNTLSFWDAVPSGDLGNPDRSAWAQRTRELLTGNGRDRNLIVWSWCGQAGGASEKDMQTYLDLMNALEKEFPAVKFVYMTGHLDGSGKDGNLNKRNEQIRGFCKKNGKVLFDFADIESYDPDGKVNYMELFATDGCDYSDGKQKKNWADEWLKNNPGNKIILPDSAAHSKPLNAARKGSAFWWMMARLSGWNPAK